MSKKNGTAPSFGLTRIEGGCDEEKEEVITRDPLRQPNLSNETEHTYIVGEEGELPLLDVLRKDELACLEGIAEHAIDSFERSSHQRAFISAKPHDISGLTMISSGIPIGEPWAVYHRPHGGDCIRVEYNPILRATTTQVISLADVPPSSTEHDASPVTWMVKPTLSVNRTPILAYDSTQNRSRVFTKRQGPFIIAALFSFVHYVAMIIGICFGALKSVSFWYILADVIVGTICRIGSGWVAKNSNNGSKLQIRIALISPVFWCMAFAGRMRKDMGRVWRLPLWTRIAMAYTAVLVNFYKIMDYVGQWQIVLAVIGFFLGGSAASLGGFLDEFTQSPGIHKGSSEFVRFTAFLHVYVMLTHIALLEVAHPNDKWIFLLAVPAVLEGLILFNIARILREIREQMTMADRLQASAESTQILAGATMVCDMADKLSQTLEDGTDCHRQYVTWVVRGPRETEKFGAAGCWQSASMLLPGPWRYCQLQEEDIARNDEGQVSTVLSLGKADLADSIHTCGDTAIALGSALTEWFQQDFRHVPPDTFYMKGENAFIRGLSGGIIGLPII